MELWYIKTLVVQTTNAQFCDLLLRSYMFRHCRHPQGADTKFSLKHTGMLNLQRTYIYFDVKLHYSHDLIVDSGGILCLKIISAFVCVRRVMLIWVHARSAFWMSCVCGSVWHSDTCPWLGLRNFRMHSVPTRVVIVPDFTYALRTILLVICVKNCLPRSRGSYVLHWTS
jgi:hypothetical protein